MNSDFLEYLISWAQRINLKNYMKLHVSNPPSRYRFQERPSKKKFEAYLFHFPNGTQGTYKWWYAVLRVFLTILFRS